MKKTVIVCGLIAGLIVSALVMYSTFTCYQKENMEGSMILGFTVMFLAFSLVFVGIKNYRDKYNGGTISFGKAFLTGLYIALIASTMYVLVWLVDFYLFVPDFIEKYTAHVLKEAAAAGATAAELEKKVEEMSFYTKMYKTPIGVALVTYLEILPVGLLVTLVSALILRRKEKKKVTSV